MIGRPDDFALRAFFNPQTPPGCPGSSTDFGPLKRDSRFPLNILDGEPRFVSQQNWSSRQQARPCLLIGVGSRRRSASQAIDLPTMEGNLDAYLQSFLPRN
jgi:hypothetical protein